MNKGKNDILIRKGEKKDLPKLLELIKELAKYENEPNEVSISIDTLEKDGFADKPVYEFFVAEKEKMVIGIALFYTKYSTWKGACLHLEDLIITQSERRSGAGTLLLKRLDAEAKIRKVKRLEWQVLNWNTPAIEFYKKHQSIFDNEWINCKLEY